MVVICFSFPKEKNSFVNLAEAFGYFTVTSAGVRTRTLLNSWILHKIRWITLVLINFVYFILFNAWRTRLKLEFRLFQCCDPLLSFETEQSWVWWNGHHFVSVFQRRNHFINLAEAFGCFTETSARVRFVHCWIREFYTKSDEWPPFL